MFVTVSEKGQVVIPASLRARLGISAGTRLEVSEENGNIVMLVEPQRKTVSADGLLYRHRRVRVRDNWTSPTRPGSLRHQAVIALDTNVLVRLVTGDDPAQARRVAARLDGGEAFFVPE